MAGNHDLAQEISTALRGDWLQTGDVARVDKGGYRTIVDRKEDMIVSGGQRLSARVEYVRTAHADVAAASRRDRRPGLTLC